MKFIGKEKKTSKVGNKYIEKNSLYFLFISVFCKKVVYSENSIIISYNIFVVFSICKIVNQGVK